MLSAQKPGRELKRGPCPSGRQMRPSLLPFSSSSAVTVTHFCPHRRFEGTPAEEPAGAAARLVVAPALTAPLQGWKRAHESTVFLTPAQLSDTGQLRVGRRCAWLWPLPSEWEPACAAPPEHGDAPEKPGWRLPPAPGVLLPSEPTPVCLSQRSSWQAVRGPPLQEPSLSVLGTRAWSCVTVSALHLSPSTVCTMSSQTAAPEPPWPANLGRASVKSEGVNVCVSFRF